MKTQHFVFSAILILALSLTVNASDQNVLNIGDEDSFNTINSVQTVDGNVVEQIVSTIPEKNFRIEPIDKQVKKITESIPQPVSKISPTLANMLNTNSGLKTVTVIVNLKDDIKVPRMVEQSRGKTTDASVIKDQLVQERKTSQAPIIAAFEKNYGIKIKEQFWLVNAFLADVPLNAIKQIADNNDVLYIQPDIGGEKPPDSNTYNDVDDGRLRINSDPYYNAGYNAGYIGLLDTGVRATHTLFSYPADHVDYLRDCVNGGSNCNTPGPNFNTNDDCWNHGTSTAGIITGNNNLGNAYRGVTGIILDSWKVYPSGCGGLSAAAVVRGFQNGLLAGDRVFVAEMQAVEGETGTIATAADNTFDAGAVVIAANGNNGPNARTVNSPAIAHKVIGIGAYDVQDSNGNTLSYQSRGPAPDGRYKPDIQLPTNTETASSASNTALQIFSGTSGSTPYGGGGAALIRNWLGHFNTYDPGATYARLILSGKKSWCCYDNNEGTGDLFLPTNSNAAWGKVTVSSSGQIIDIPLSIGSGKTKLEAALWWPEKANQAHNDVDVYIIDPSGAQRALGYDGPSVFEHAKVAGSLSAGAWKVRIRGFNINSPQTVYWTSDLK